MFVDNLTPPGAKFGGRCEAETVLLGIFVGGDGNVGGTPQNVTTIGAVGGMPKRILAIASGGGHWEQMLLLRPAFDDADVHFVTTADGFAEHAGIADADIVADFNRRSPLAGVRCSIALLRIVRRVRPDLVISTGAAPGLVGLIIGRLFGAKTVWIDSVANSDQLSMSGKVAGRFVDLWLTQWEHLASARGPRYFGSLL